MAGHSKWANIKHRKSKQDAKRGKLYTKLIREITVSARLGGGDPADNPRLRAVVDKALTANMPKDTVDRAIARGTGGLEGEQVEELTYEGYGPGGVAILLEVITDNRNRTVAEVRHAFSKHGGNLGTDGSVAYLFSKRGIISYAPGVDEDALMEVALESGADDIEAEETGALTVITDPVEFPSLVDALRARGMEPDHAEVTMLPASYVTLDGELADKVSTLLEVLEDLDDVQNVYSNADLPTPEVE
jgi:YebC/PmpR family DNA-binding regulatory protein